MGTLPVVKAMLSAFAQNWPDRADYCRDPKTVAFWQKYTDDIADDLLSAASKTVITESTFFPKVAEVRKMAFTLQKDGLNLPDAEAAWGFLLRWMRATSYILGKDGVARKKPPLPPPIQRAVEYLGGVDEIGRSDNPVADRARFIEAYRRVMERAEHQVTMLPEVRKLVQRAALPEGLRGLIEGGRDALSGAGDHEAGHAGDVSRGVLDPIARGADTGGRGDGRQTGTGV